MKRKEGESSFEFRQRVKKAKYKRAHQFDEEKQYWQRVTQNQRRGIENLFARAGAASSSGAAAYNAARGVNAARQIVQDVVPYVPAIEEAIGVGAATDLLAAVPMVPPVISGAIAAAGVIGYGVGSIVDAVGNLMDTDSTQNILNLMPGTYQGKFALSKKASTKGLRDKYQKKGGVFIVENYGSVSDPDLCYIGHSTYNTECIRHSIGYAILRKLFKKGAGCDISTPYEVLPLKSHNASGVNAFKIIYHCRDTDGTEFNYGHDIDAAESLHTLLFKNAGGFCLYDFLNSALLDNNAQIIEDIFLYSHDNVLAGRLDMSKEVLNIAMSSHMVIQNRTKGAGETGATVTTAIDVQPLKGPVYEFSIPIPKLKSDVPFIFNSTDINGLFLLRANQLTPAGAITSYREPPVKNAFQSVVKSGYARLNPGALKSMTVGCDVSGYFSNVLHKLRFSQDTGRVKFAYGKSQLACFEEELNSGSLNNITVSYECQHIAGAELVTTVKSNMQPGYSAGPVNNP